MECDGSVNDENRLIHSVDEQRSSVNSVILDYYKKFGRKRDLEQYFSLSTAHSDIKDPSSLFWRRMKALTDSSDSGEKDDSSKELCRISIKCSIPESSEASHSQEDKIKNDSESIITECIQTATRNLTDDECAKSDDNQSQKSVDITLDNSANKLFSPTSSITSQRKLEWDSLADVGYGNDSERKNSASSLSTLERLALQQQYSNNETKHESFIGPPTAQSTPIETNDTVPKTVTSISQKTTKYHKKDIDKVLFNVPDHMNVTSQGISINLTKQISFNIENTTALKQDSSKQDVIPEKSSVETEVPPQLKVDKEMQTSLKRSNEISNSTKNNSNPCEVPVLICLNTLKRKYRKKRLKSVKRKLIKHKKSNENKENIPTQEKNVGPVSEAESFEYMPGHMYNQNKLRNEQIVSTTGNPAGNKSSLESSGGLNTDSTSKSSKHSFTKDLQKSIDLMKIALQQPHDDSNQKKELIKEVVRRLLKSQYRDDESTTDFLSGLSFNSKKLCLGGSHYTTTSTSDTTNSMEKNKNLRPKKSILRLDKSHGIASTSQSTPNLQSAVNSDKITSSSLSKLITLNNTESDESSKEKTSDTALKTSSEELYQKYLQAFRREEAYRKYLKDKEVFLKQKLTSSEIKVPHKQFDLRTNHRLNDLIKDLTRNNYDDGSGDASKLEGGSSSYMNLSKNKPIKEPKSHSVFTLSSCDSEKLATKNNSKIYLENEIKDTENPSAIKESKHYCCCPYHMKNIGKAMTDTSAQVNLKYVNENSFLKQKITEKDKVERNTHGGESNAYECDCNRRESVICKCPCFPRERENDLVRVHYSKTKDENKPSTSKIKQTTSSQDNIRASYSSDSDNIPLRRISKYSQTNLNLPLKMLPRKLSDKSTVSWSSDEKKINTVSRLRNISNSTSNDYYESGSSSKQGNVILEGTRCIQTDISINPKISNPSLSDIQIINKDDCVKLIGEAYRKVEKHSSTNKSNDVATENSLIHKASELKSFTDKTPYSIAIHSKSTKETQSDLLNTIQNNIDTREMLDNYTIPIAGTNMTLMVKINQCNHESNKNLITKNNLANKDTHLKDEYLKDVQSTNIFQQISDSDKDILPKPLPVIDNKLNIFDEISMKISPTDRYNLQDQTKTTFGLNDVQGASHTYPRKEQFHGQSVLLRSNSDTNCGGTQIYHIPERINKATEITPIEYSKFEEKLSKVTLREDKPTRQNNNCEFIDNVNNVFICNGCLQENCICKNCITQSEPFDESNLLKTDTVNSRTGEIDKHYENEDEKNSDVNATAKKVEPKTNDKIEKESKKHLARKLQRPIQSPKTRSDSPKLTQSPKKILKTQMYSRKSSKSSSPQHQSNTKSPNRSYSPAEKTNRAEPKMQGKRLNSMTRRQTEMPKSDNIGEVEKHTNEKILQTEALNSGSENKQISSDLSKSTESSRYTACEITENSDDIISHKSSKSIKKSDSTDPILDLIQDITNRYSKRDIDKKNKRKCFKQIINVMNYLLDTEETTEDQEQLFTEDDHSIESKGKPSIKEYPKEECFNRKDNSCQTNLVAGKSVSTSCDRPSKHKYVCSKSSDVIISTDVPTTSSDSATCKILNKIKRECEKYHQKRCKCHHGSGKIYTSSSTSVNCKQCNRVHTCGCRPHKCKSHSKPKLCTDKKKNVAYNLIIQTSDSMVTEDLSTPRQKNCQQLKDIVVKVPSQRTHLEKLPFKEVTSRIERCMQRSNAHVGIRGQRARSLPRDSEISSTDEKCRKGPTCTVRDYLEQNRPDFVEQCSQRQNCLKLISQSRSKERSAQRKLLAMQLERLSTVKDRVELQEIAAEIGENIRRKKIAAKFINEREMKKHSEKIYKSLPEVIHKKEQTKKEGIKKTNMLMASIFRKNLQKKTLRGSVNLSNYSTVIKI